MVKTSLQNWGRLAVIFRRAENHDDIGGLRLIKRGLRLDISSEMEQVGYNQNREEQN